MKFMEKYINQYNLFVEDHFDEIMNNVIGKNNGFYSYRKNTSLYFNISIIENLQDSIETLSCGNKFNKFPFNVDELKFEWDTNKVLSYIINDLTTRLLKCVENNNEITNSELLFLSELSTEFISRNSRCVNYLSPEEQSSTFRLDDINYKILVMICNNGINYLYKDTKCIMTDDIIENTNILLDLISNNNAAKIIFKANINRLRAFNRKVIAKLILNTEDCLREYNESLINHCDRDAYNYHFNDINTLMLYYSGDKNNIEYKNLLNNMLENMVRKAPIVFWKRYYGRNNIKILTEICNFIEDNKDLYKYNTRNIKKINAVRLEAMI